MIPREQFHISGLAGEKALSGTIPIRGAKNAVLPAMAAAPLFADALTYTNLPDIEDVGRMSELIEASGAHVDRQSIRRTTIDPRYINTHALSDDLSKRLRASIILTGPMLARCGRVSFAHPGGCVIGARPIDIFLDGFRKMGARVRRRGERYDIHAPDDGLYAADIFFKLVSVTATETFMMAATRARGTTVLRNAAMEPEIEDLANLLNTCGARIEGAGTPTITIHGRKQPLRARGHTYRAMPDRIEAGSFLILAALAGDDIRITHCNPKHVDILIELLRESGVPIETERSAITISGNRRVRTDTLTPLSIRTHEYPGFPTDLQAPMTVFLTQVNGESVVFETIFENRLNYTQDLITMGADITMWDPHRIMIRGPQTLRGHELDGPDIRAGLAFIIAAAIAKGESLINNTYYIDRGYERIETRLQDIGLDITRVAV